jgi:hypothetical protein
MDDHHYSNDPSCVRCPEYFDILQWKEATPGRRREGIYRGRPAAAEKVIRLSDYEIDKRLAISAQPIRRPIPSPNLTLAAFGKPSIKLSLTKR